VNAIDFDRLQPLQLARGSHHPGSGKGCAMNVISYITGEAKITDYPSCSDDMVSTLVQAVNDVLADPWTGLLTPEDALAVVELGMLTVGTGNLSRAAKELGVVGYTEARTAWANSEAFTYLSTAIATKAKRMAEVLRWAHDRNYIRGTSHSGYSLTADGLAYTILNGPIEFPTLDAADRSLMIENARKAILEFRRIFLIDTEVPEMDAVRERLGV